MPGEPLGEEEVPRPPIPVAGQSEGGRMLPPVRQRRPSAHQEEGTHEIVWRFSRPGED